MRRVELTLAAVVTGWVLLTAVKSHAQSKKQSTVEGRITFMTSRNLYVRFPSTKGLAPGDTVFLGDQRKKIPVMVIKYLSSESCSGEILGTAGLKTGERVYAEIYGPARPVVEKDISASPPDSASEESRREIPASAEVISGNSFRRIYGGITANSYSSFSNFSTGSGNQRWYYSFALNGDNLMDSGLSFSSYMNYSYLGSQWKDLRVSPLRNLKVYDLTLSYRSGDSRIWGGRHINPAISEVGPIDGIQFQTEAGPVVVGAALGSRPDYYTYGYNPSLFEIGGYVSRADTFNDGNMTNTIGLFQQYNRMKTDRRFIYFQNVTNPSNDISFYLSGEADIFTLRNGSPSGDISLTDMYLSTFYTPANRISLSLSYSAQRNTIYYQTFGISVDSLLPSQNQLRHNMMLGATFRPFGSTFLRMSGGYSFQQGDVSPTRNLMASITQGNIPILELSATISFSTIKSGFMSGSMYGVRLLKYIPLNSTNVSLGYQQQKYTFGAGAGNSVQDQLDLTLNTRLLGRMFLNLYYQGIFSGSTTFGSFMGGFSYRF